jgi:hypothetical protein
MGRIPERQGETKKEGKKERKKEVRQENCEFKGQIMQWLFSLLFSFPVQHKDTYARHSQVLDTVGHGVGH